MIELLPLQMEHCEAVAGIAEQSIPEHWSLQGIRDVLRYDNNIYFVARHRREQIIVGFAGIMVIADEAELLNIAVHPSYRGAGIGMQLLDKVIAEASRKQAVRLLLEVRKSNEVAIRLYQNRQFTKLGERKGYYSNPTEDAIIMERML